MDAAQRRGQEASRARGRAPQVVAFVAAFATVTALVVLLALPIWILLRIPGALVAPGPED